MEPKNANGRGRLLVKTEFKTKKIKSRTVAAMTAAYYLMDYEGGRPPIMSNFDTITQDQLRLYRIHYSWMWRWLGVNFAVVLLFVANAENRTLTVLIHTYAIIIFLVEIWMKEGLLGPDHSRDFEHPDRYLVRPLLIFLLALGVESWVRLIFLGTNDNNNDGDGSGSGDESSRPFMLVTALFKPAVAACVCDPKRLVESTCLEKLLRKYHRGLLLNQPSKKRFFRKHRGPEDRPCSATRN